MADKTYRLAPALFYDGEGIQKRQERMAAKGWLLEKAGQNLWRYRRIQPQALRFAAAYLADTSEFDPAPTGPQQEFYDYCAAAGWQFAAQYHQLHLFYTFRPDPVPIETDEALRLRATHAALTKSRLLLAGLLGLLLVIYLVALYRFTSTPRLMASPNTLTLAGVCLLFALMLLAECGSYWLWYLCSRRSVARGGPCARVAPFRVMHHLLYGMVFALLAVLLAGYWAGRAGIDWPFWARMARYAFVVAAALGLRALLKRRGARRAANIAATLALIVVLTFATEPLMNWVSLLDARGQAAAEPSQPHTADLTLPDGTQTRWTYFADDLPLQVEDLLPETAGIRYSCEQLDRERSALAGYLLCEQRPAPTDPDVPGMYYSIVETAVGPWYDRCLNGELKKAPGHWQKLELELCGSSGVYQMLPGGAGSGLTRPEYLICWQRRYARLVLDWQPTDAQLAAAARALKEYRF